MSKWGPQGYFEADGSYNERPRPPKPKADTSFRLHFDRPIGPQLPTLSENQVSLVIRLVQAQIVLVQHGILPGQHGPRAERKINMMIDRMIRKQKQSSNPP